MNLKLITIFFALSLLLAGCVHTGVQEYKEKQEILFDYDQTPSFTFSFTKENQESLNFFVEVEVEELNIRTSRTQTITVELTSPSGEVYSKDLAFKLTQGQPTQARTASFKGVPAESGNYLVSVEEPFGRTKLSEATLQVYSVEPEEE